MTLSELYPAISDALSYSTSFRSSHRWMGSIKEGDVVMVRRMATVGWVRYVFWPEAYPVMWEYDEGQLYGFRIKKLKK